MPRRGVCCVRAMEADSQSGRFKLCDLARQAVQGRDRRPALARPGWTGSGLGGEAGPGGQGIREAGQSRGEEVADRHVSTEPLSTIPK